jgi:hypothetical protein
MKQVLHIFAKDARHQWLEILLSSAFIATLAFTYHSRWKEGGFLGVTVSFTPWALWEGLAPWLLFIIPLGWWLLISPLIHDEKLVGDRQFWITRPYEWKKLLAAKALFLIVFLYVPLLIAQFVLLAQAGFSPFFFIAGLLYDLFLLTCVLVLPLVTLASVTRNFARMTLAALGVLACLVAIVLLSSKTSPDRVAIPYAGTIALSLAVCICVAVVVLQYARRRARVSWSLLGLLVVACGALTMGGAPDNASMKRDFPLSTQTPAPARFAYGQEQEDQPSAFVTQKSDWVGISIPVHVSGVAEGSIVIPNFLKVTLQAPDGSHWTSVWQAISMSEFLPGERVASERFIMPRSLYDSFKGKLLNARVEIALTQARAGNTTQIHLPLNDFSVPEVGVCTPLTGVLERPDDIAGIVCRAPLRQPALNMVQTTWSEGSCATGSPNAGQGVQGAGWVGSLDREPAELGIVPVWFSQVDLSNREKTENQRFVEMRKLCPGTLVSFTSYKLSGRTQSSLWISGFRLPELNRGQQAVIDRD